MTSSRTQKTWAAIVDGRDYIIERVSWRGRKPLFDVYQGRAVIGAELDLSSAKSLISMHASKLHKRKHQRAKKAGIE